VRQQEKRAGKSITNFPIRCTSFMKPTPQQSLEAAKVSLKRDIAALDFDGLCITGRHGLVSANIKTRQLFFRRKAGERPFCVVKIPVPGPDSSEALRKSLAHPLLRGWNNADGLDDMTAVLMGFMEFVDLKKPVDLQSMTMTPEAEQAFRVWTNKK
jgi:hypothetical protein